MKRWEVEQRSANASAASGMRLVVTRKGVEVDGWYDHYVGNDDPLFIPWNELDRLRYCVGEGIPPAVKR